MNHTNWQWIFGSSKKPSVNSNQKKVESMSVSVYVTNFLYTTSTKELCKVCEPYGVISDVYIARKISNKVKDLVLFIFYLCKMRIV